MKTWVLLLVMAGAGLALAVEGAQAQVKVQRRATRYSSGPDTTVVFGPTTYDAPHVYGSGTPWTYYYESFTISPYDSTQRFIFRITNGDPDGSHRVNGVDLSLNGRTVMNLSDVSGTVAFAIKVVSPLASNTMVLGVRSPYNPNLEYEGDTDAHIVLDMISTPDPSYDIYGPTEFVMEELPDPQPPGGGYTELSDSLSRPTGSVAPYALIVTNGAADGSQRVASARVYVNGTLVIGANECGPGTAQVMRQVTLAAQNELKVRLTGDPGDYINVSVTATDTTPPGVTVTAPTLADSLTTASGVRVTGSVTENETGGTVRVNGQTAFSIPGSFSDSVAMAVDGRYVITVQAVNGAGYVTEVTRTVIRDTQAPTLTVSQPSADSLATTADSLPIVCTWVDSTRTTVTVDGDSVMAGTQDTLNLAYPLDHGSNRILIRATDALGNTSEAWRFVLRREANDQNNQTVVPTVPGVAGRSSFLSGVAFIYDSTRGTPLQRHAVPESIGAEVASVVRGVVTSRDFGPLPNVKVEVAGHPGFGYALTRDDGQYDMVVNGGLPLTLRFTKPNHLEAQRTVLPPVQDYALLDTVALIGKTVRKTVVDFNSPVVARGRFASDANGDRDIRMVFRDTTVATVRKPDGTVVPFTAARVRATEFTVGGDGPRSMPAILPPGSAYTYCVDLRLDEADSLAQEGQPAPDVHFSKPVACYVRNFLNLPVGTCIPVGYYDYTAGRWVAGRDGVVLKIIGASGDSVDSRGTGTPDDSTRLAQLDMDSAEIGRLRSQYTVGTSVWRMSAEHFTTYDFNLNVAMMMYAQSRAAARAMQPLGLVGNASTVCGSIVECENRVLGEQVPIVGTPYTLNYRSFRASGDLAMRSLRIPVTGETVPEGVGKIIVDVDVAGSHRRRVFTSPAPGLIDTMTWDGRDVYGRLVEGAVNARVSIGYVYDLVYARGNGGSSFGNHGASSGNLTGMAVGDRGIGRIVWSRQTVSLGAPSTATDGLGGWTLSPHHFFDLTGRGSLYYGDGSVRSGDHVLPCIWTVMAPPIASAVAIAPDGSIFVGGGGYIKKRRPDGVVETVAGSQAASGNTTYSGDGAATSVRLPYITAMALGPDGSVYFTLDGAIGFPNVRACRLVRDTIFTIADSTGVRACGGVTGGVGDGGPAKQAGFGTLVGIAVGPDGSVYLGDHDDYRVRRIAPDGTISTYAGTGEPRGLATPSDGHATASKLRGMAGLATDPEGNLFIAEGSSGYVLKVAPDGWLTTVVPGGTPTFNPSAIAIAPDGAMYIASKVEGRIYRREPDESMTPFAGVGLAGFDPADEGKPAAGVKLGNIVGMAVAPDGSIYPAEGSGTLRRIGATLLGKTATEFAVPDDEGSELYYFDYAGRHLHTVDALTGGVRYRFTYYESGNSSGRLRAIYDMNGDSTVIERRADGSPEVLRGPYGAETQLATTGNALTSIENPAHEAITLDYWDGGLLKSFQDARLNVHSFTYAADGRLEQDSDPPAAGGYQHLDASWQTTGSREGMKRRVERTTALNRQAIYTVIDSLNGGRRREIAGPGPGVTTIRDGVDMRVVTTTPDGFQTADSLSSGGRFGMLAPISLRRTERLPSQKARTVETTNQWSPGYDPPRVHGTWTERVSVNTLGRYETTFNSQTRCLATTTPEGRADSVVVDSVGRPTTAILPGVAPVQIQYDGHGRPWHVTQGSRTWTYWYDSRGRVQTITDPASRSTLFQYDQADQCSVQVLPGGRVVGFGYDANGNLTTVTPPEREPHSFGYTAVNLVGSYTPPVVPGVPAPGTAYPHNADRQLDEVQRPDGGTVLLGYNSTTGQLETVTQPHGVSRFHYDGTSGLLTAVESPDSVTVTLGHDGPLVTSQLWTGGTSGRLDYAHNRNFLDSLVTVTVGGATDTASYSYDRDGLTTRAGRQSIHRRAVDGSVDSTQVGLLTQSQDYSTYGELANLRYAWNGTALFQQSLQRDVLGRIELLREVAFGTDTLYGYRYDAAGRLYAVTTNGDTTARYGYDANGNRTRVVASGDTIAAEYDTQDRLLSVVTSGGDTTRYAYTGAGELQRAVTGPDTTRYTYDALGNLLRVVVSGDTIEYVIDGLNRRVGRKVNGAWTHRWLYADGLRPVAELDGTGALVARYVYGTRGHVPDYVVRGDSVYRLVTDQLGSVRGVVNVATGAVVERIAYDAWGVVKEDTQPGYVSLGYAGGLRDAATGLVRFGARDYDATVGRWTCKDPIGFAGGDGNLYAYVGESPINDVDPGGWRRTTWGTARAGSRPTGATPAARVAASADSVTFWAQAEASTFRSAALPAPTRSPASARRCGAAPRHRA